MMDPLVGYGQLAEYFVAGSVGAIGGICLQGERFRLPFRVASSTGEVDIEPGFLRTLVAAGVLAVLGAGNIHFINLPPEWNGPRGFIALGIGLVVGMGGKAAVMSLFQPLARLLGAGKEQG
jgi:hypothetical protein